MPERPTLESLTKVIRSIPTLPAVLGELSRRLEDPKTSSEELAQVIQKDQALSSKVLKLVNSPFYGYSSRIHSISQGIMILGFNAVKNLVLSTSVLEAFRSTPSGDGFRLEDLWLHSAATSCAAKVLAETQRNADPDEAFVAGLLHDIGKVVLWSAAPDFFRSAVHLSQERHISFGKILQETLGFRDEDVGAELALRWNFPPNLREAIRCREHSIESTANNSNSLAPILQAANLLACACGYHDLPSTPLSAPSPQNWQHLGLNDHEHLRTWIHDSTPRMRLSCTFLEMLD